MKLSLSMKHRFFLQFSLCVGSVVLLVSPCWASHYMDCLLDVTIDAVDNNVLKGEIIKTQTFTGSYFSCDQQKFSMNEGIVIDDGKELLPQIKVGDHVRIQWTYSADSSPEPPGYEEYESWKLIDPTVEFKKNGSLLVLPYLEKFYED